jgi:hypothetical protein
MYVPPTTTTLAATTTSSSTTTTVEALKSNSGTWNYSFSNGYKASMTLTVWQIAADDNGVIQHPADPSFKLTAGSEYDPKKDIVIPAQVSVRNNTASWALPYCYVQCFVGGTETYSGATPVYTPVDVDLIIGYSDGTKDTTRYSGQVDQGYVSIDHDVNAGVPGTKWSNGVSVGGSVSSQKFLVVRNYYAPARPKGDPTLLGGMIITTDMTEVVGDGSLGNESVTASDGADREGGLECLPQRYGVTLLGKVQE